MFVIVSIPPYSYGPFLDGRRGTNYFNVDETKKITQRPKYTQNFIYTNAKGKEQWTEEDARSLDGRCVIVLMQTKYSTGSM